MLIAHNGLIVCFNCNGKGYCIVHDIDKVCPECNGKGEDPQPKEVVSETTKEFL